MRAFPSQTFRGSAITGIAIDRDNNAMYIAQARVGV
jgi:hypothetical protein